MILTETSSISSGVLPFYSLKNHLRMGTGFVEDDLQDPLLEAYLRAAIATIENKLGIAILQREFVLNLTAWRAGTRQHLPMRPVQSITSVTLFDHAGAATLIADDVYQLHKDDQSPAIETRGVCLPSIPAEGSADIVFTAGYGAIWDEVPADLGQAVLLLAAFFYENRMGAPTPSGVLPMAVLALIEAYRPVRVSGGTR